MAQAPIPDHLPAITQMAAQGITIADLSALTGRTAGEIEGELLGVKPLRGVQQRGRVYDLYEALGALGAKEDPAETAKAIESAITRMKPSQLPAALSKEFWQGQQARLTYQQEVDLLWKQARVQRAMGELLKVMRQSLTLMTDNVDRQTALTDRQRTIIQGIADATLAECRDTIAEHFKGWEGELDKEERNPA